MNIASEHIQDHEQHNSFMFRMDTSQKEVERIVWSALRRGNRKALDYIFEKYIRLLYAYGAKISKDKGLIEECIQDLFVEIWNRREILSDTDSIKFYFLKSLRRKIIRRLMVAQRLHTATCPKAEYENELEFSAEFQIIQAQTSYEERQKLTLALAQLSKRQREAVYLKFYEQMSYAEISDMMNLSIKSSYKLICKAIEALRKTIRIEPSHSI